MNAVTRSLRLALFAVAPLCTHEPLRAQSQASVRPVADHHAHLQSLAAWPLFHAELPVIQLPADLDTVLREFERGWRSTDKRILAALFTEDGIFQWGDDWLRGPDAIRVELLGRVGGLRLRPQSFESSDLLGYIAGAYGYYRDSTWVDQGRYVMNLRRANTPSPWRITATLLHNTTPPIRPTSDPIPAPRLIAQLDSAGIRRAAVLSLAYQFGAFWRRIPDEIEKTRAENDWVATEVARYPDRLVGFCSVNPLKYYALDELDRCTRHANLKGLKLHFTNSGVDLRNREHVERLREVFRMANARHYPIVVHMRTLDPDYGRRDVEIFVRDVLPEAPDIPIQIAHLAGWGGFGPETTDALGMFAQAIAAGDLRTSKLYFDLSAIVNSPLNDAAKQSLVGRIRQIGVRRFLFAVDGADSPARVWQQLTQLPFTPAELNTIASNLAPWMR